MNSFSVEQFDVVASILKNIVESSLREEHWRRERREGDCYDADVEVVSLQKEVHIILI